MKLLIKTTVVFLFIALVVGGATVNNGAVAGDLPGEGQQLTLAYGYWIGEHLPDYIIKILLEEELGYEEVEIRTMGVPMIYKGIEAGEVDLYASMWLPNQKEQYEEHKDIIEKVSTIYDDALQGWLVPAWFAEEYNVNSIEDLKRKEIIEKLDLTGNGKGDLIGGPTGWLATEINNQKLEEYGLDEDYNQLIGEEIMLNYTLQGALEDGEPVLFYGFTPDWFFAEYPVPDEVVWLEDPYGYWPPDPEMDAGELGWPPNIVHIIAPKGFSQEHPEAAEVLGKLRLKIKDINRSIYLQTVEEETGEEELMQHAREWIEENEALVEEMLSGVK